MIGKIKDIRLLLLAALPAFMLASCSQEEMDGGQGTQSGEIRFEIGFAPQSDAMQTNAHTRVATDTEFRSTWEKGDEIGVFAVEHGKDLAASDNLIHNVKLTYTGSEWTGPAYWPTLSSGISKLDFYAYYPYSESVDDPTAINFNVYTDQSRPLGTKSTYNLSDLLMAKDDNSGGGVAKGEVVQLSFKHALAMVQVKISREPLGNYDSELFTVSLNGCAKGATLNLASQSTSTTAGAATKIRMYPCPNDGGKSRIYAYRALVPAQTIAAGTPMFRFEYGENTLLSSEPLAASMSLTGGKAELFDMSFPYTLATVSEGVRLRDLFTSSELTEITHLKVMGQMKRADFAFINDMPEISHLHLGEATVEGNKIPDNAFSRKTSLKEFIFPENITAIGDHAFDWCSGLTGDLVIPSKVTTIGYHAFFYCSGFDGTLTLPAELTTIGDFAFYSCSGFKSITCHIEDPTSEGSSYSANAFDDVPVGTPLYVPAAAIAIYKANEPWSRFGDNIYPISQQ